MGALAPGARQQWQFFLVTHNGVVEIQADGTIFYRPVLPAPVQDTARADSPEDADGDRQDKEPGFMSDDGE
jgi:hypothetical protein